MKRFNLLFGVIIILSIMGGCRKKNDITSPSEKPPSSPTLSSPLIRSKNVTIRPTLNWKTAVGALSYCLQVATNLEFEPIMIDQSGITDTSYTVSGLLDNTTYFWRVNAMNSGGASNWSSIWTFTTTDRTKLITFTKLFAEHDDALAYSVQQTVDGGYIIAGVRNQRACLIKTDINGDQVWEQIYDSDYAKSVQQTFDGGYILAGKIRYNNSNEAWLLKTDANGSPIWEQIIDVLGGHAESLRQTLDGGYIMVGHEKAGSGHGVAAWQIKTDVSGNQVWKNTYSGNNTYWAYDVQQTEDRGYIVVGQTTSPNSGVDAWLVKTDENGNQVWEMALGGNDSEAAFSVQQTSDGGFIIAGYSGFNAWLLKTFSSGRQAWEKSFSGWARSVQQTADGGYILAGTIGSFDGITNNVLLIKTDRNGNQEWEKTFGGNNVADAFSAQQTFDGGYIVAGRIYSNDQNDIWLIKTDANGNVAN